MTTWRSGRSSWPSARASFSSVAASIALSSRRGAGGFRAGRVLPLTREELAEVRTVRGRP